MSTFPAEEHEWRRLALGAVINIQHTVAEGSYIWQQAEIARLALIPNEQLSAEVKARKEKDEKNPSDA